MTGQHTKPHHQSAWRHLTRCLRLIGALALVLVGSTMARSHEGEDHGAPVAVPTSGVGLLSVSASTDGFEALLKYPVTLAGRPFNGLLYLADYRTNAPIAGAQIAVQIQGSDLSATAVPTDRAGIYALSVPTGFPANGHYDLVLSLTVGTGGDLILLSSLSIGPVAGLDPPPTHEDGWGWRWLLGGLLLLTVAAVIFFWRRRRATLDPILETPR